MITYVNSVFVSNLTSGSVASSLANVAKGQFIFWDFDANAAVSANTVRFKIGMGTGKGIKWSNIINVDDIKGWIAHTAVTDTEDKVFVDFTGMSSAILNKLALGGKRLIVRLTFKDLPTRFRKWTESYEYVTNAGDDKNKIANAIANMINKEVKRARVIATVGTFTKGTQTFVAGALDANTGLYAGNAVQLEAMKYDDDDSVDSINWANKVRFNANVYYTDPAAEGWESLNKNFPTGVEITKLPGKTDQGSGKLVRDRESQAMGYEGILNRGEGTWPIIKPAMETDITKSYNVVTLEFENMYRTADDLFRKTKQTVEIYTLEPLSTGEGEQKVDSALIAAFKTLTGGIVDKTNDKIAEDIQ